MISCLACSCCIDLDVVVHSLVAIVAGEKGKPVVESIIHKFRLEGFSFMLFHYDNSAWNEFEWYSDVVSIRFDNA